MKSKYYLPCFVVALALLCENPAQACRWCRYRHFYTRQNESFSARRTQSNGGGGSGGSASPEMDADSGSAGGQATGKAAVTTGGPTATEIAAATVRLNAVADQIYNLSGGRQGAIETIDAVMGVVSGEQDKDILEAIRERVRAKPDRPLLPAASSREDDGFDRRIAALEQERAALLAQIRHQKRLRTLGDEVDPFADDLSQLPR